MKGDIEKFAQERERLRVVLATIMLNIVAVLIFAVVPWSNWRTGLGLGLLDNAILIAYTIRRRDSLMAHLMIFGLVAGVAELAADAWLVAGTRTLDYSIGGGPMLWRSPLWMPIAWEIVAVQFGYIGLRLADRWDGLGLLAAGLLGAVNIPFYEEMARRTNWWSYSNCRMLSHTPYYIIAGEYLITVFFAILALEVRKKKPALTILAGAVAGTSVFVCYGLAYELVDGLVSKRI
jgi:hypothetical protein